MVSIPRKPSSGSSVPFISFISFLLLPPTSRLVPLPSVCLGELFAYLAPGLPDPELTRGFHTCCRATATGARGPFISQDLFHLEPRLLARREDQALHAKPMAAACAVSKGVARRRDSDI